MEIKFLNTAVQQLEGKTPEETTKYFFSLMKKYDQDTANHCYRVKNVAVNLASQIGFSDDIMQEIAAAALLHDIGKLATPKNILCKPGKLNQEEFALIKQHSDNGYKILSLLPQLEYIAEYVLHHHERYDGTGYPVGKSGKEIPLISRILTLADVYESITSDRVYRKAMSQEEALKIISEGREKLFDPILVDIFLDSLGEEILFASQS